MAQTMNTLTTPPLTWQQLPNEPARWYARFLAVCEAGSKLAAYNLEREAAGKGAAGTVPGRWQEIAAEWQWEERLEAWRIEQAERRKAEYEEERLRRRDRRRQLLEAGLNKLEKAIAQFKPDEANASQIASLLKALMENERIEFDDMPAQRLELGNDEGGLQITITHIPARGVGADGTAT